MEYSSPFSSNDHPISYNPLAANICSSGKGKTKQKCGDPNAKTRKSGHGKKSSSSSPSSAHHQVKLSTDAQSVAARERRHRISERFKILQSLVPGGSKMDTVSMLEEAIHYVKFLKAQIWLHQTMIMSANVPFVDDDFGKKTENDHLRQTMLFQIPQDHQHYESYAQLLVMNNTVIGDQGQGFAGGDVGPMMLPPGYANSGTEFEDNDICRFS